MRCKTLQKWISAQCDGELDDARSAIVRDHLTACGPCRAFAADLTRLEKTLAAHEAADGRAGFAPRVMSRLTHERSGAVSIDWLDFWRPAPVAVAVAAFSIGVTLTAYFNADPPADPAFAQVDESTGDESELGVQPDPDSVENLLLALLPEGGR